MRKRNCPRSFLACGMNRSAHGSARRNATRTHHPRQQALALGVTAEGIRHRVRRGQWLCGVARCLRLAGRRSIRHIGSAQLLCSASGPDATLSHSERRRRCTGSLPGFSIEPLTVSVRAQWSTCYSRRVLLRNRSSPCPPVTTSSRLWRPRAPRSLGRCSICAGMCSASPSRAGLGHRPRAKARDASCALAGARSSLAEHGRSWN